jgi:hypothetical protein
MRPLQRNLYKKIRAIITLCLSIYSLISSGQAGTAPVSAPQMPGPFAIDGYIQRQGTRADWLAGPAGTNNIVFTDQRTSLIPLSVIATDQYNTASDDVFAKASLQDNPNAMKWTLRKATSKTDLNNFLVFLALNTANNHIWIVLGADRRSTGKNSSIDIELLQNQVSMTGGINTSLEKGFVSVGPHGGRTVGDLTISVTFQNSDGVASSVQYLQWQPGFNIGDYSYFPINPPAGTAFTASNSVSIDVPFGAFGSATYAPYTFVEAAIDVTSLIGGTGLPPNECSRLPLETIWVKSKSNDNYDDFIPPFQFKRIFGFPLTANSFFLDLYTAQLTADITPEDPANYNFHWTARGGSNGTVLDQSITGSLDNYDIPNPIFSADTNYQCISYVYRVSVSRKSNPTCIVGETDVIINSPCKIGKPINPDQANLNRNFINENTVAEDEIRIFPNPSKGSATIDLSSYQKIKNIELIDMKGTIVQHWSNMITNTIQFKNLPHGIYLLKIILNNGETKTKKIIINK